jgi:hypothetical protein
MPNNAHTDYRPLMAGSIACPGGSTAGVFITGNFAVGDLNDARHPFSQLFIVCDHNHRFANLDQLAKKIKDILGGA